MVRHTETMKSRQSIRTRFSSGILGAFLLALGLWRSCLADFHTRCPVPDPLKCPDNWFPFDDKCFTVREEAKSYTEAEYDCNRFGAVVIGSDMNWSIRACAYDVLKSKRELVIHVGHTDRMNVVTGEITHSDDDYPYVCIFYQSDYNKVSFSKFSLKHYGQSGVRTVDLTRPLFSRVGRFQHLRQGELVELHCDVTGKPSLWWNITLGHTGVSGHYVNFQVSQCGYLGTFTCQAGTSFETVSKSIELYAKCDHKIVDFRFSPSGTISANSDVSVICVTEGYPLPVVKIQSSSGKKWKDVEASRNSDNPSELIHHVGVASCDLTGTRYQCQAALDGQMLETSRTLWINNCPPVLCPGEEQRKTVYSALGDTARFSLCVIAFPGFGTALHIDTYWIENHRSRKGFSWQYEKMANISEYAVMVTFTVENIQSDRYGELTFNLWTTAGYNMEYIVDLKPKRPPLCPTDITIIKRESDGIGLSWQPRLDDGPIQSFHVYYTTDNVTWSEQQAGQETSANVTGLEEDTIYTFRVVASNQFFTRFSENTCGLQISYNTSEYRSLCM